MPVTCSSSPQSFTEMSFAHRKWGYVRGNSCSTNDHLEVIMLADSENLAERVGFELTLERKFKNMQRTGCAF
jgi:hypothetical protein